MTLNQVCGKWTGIQTFLKDACYFMCLCTIADELDSKYDFIDAINMCIDRGWMRGDGYIVDALSVLWQLTGRQFKLEKLDCVPDKVKESQFTVLKYRRGDITHFRRRFVDTVVNSQTVKYGKLEKVYLFEVV